MNKKNLVAFYFFNNTSFSRFEKSSECKIEYSAQYQSAKDTADILVYGATFSAEYGIINDKVQYVTYCHLTKDGDKVGDEIVKECILEEGQDGMINFIIKSPEGTNIFINFALSIYNNKIGSAYNYGITGGLTIASKMAVYKDFSSIIIRQAINCLNSDIEKTGELFSKIIPIEVEQNGYKLLNSRQIK